MHANKKFLTPQTVSWTHTLLHAIFTSKMPCPCTFWFFVAMAHYANFLIYNILFYRVTRFLYVDNIISLFFRSQTLLVALQGGVWNHFLAIFKKNQKSLFWPLDPSKVLKSKCDKNKSFLHLDEIYLNVVSKLRWNLICGLQSPKTDFGLFSLYSRIVNIMHCAYYICKHAGMYRAMFGMKYHFNICHLTRKKIQKVLIWPSVRHISAAAPASPTELVGRLK